MWILFVLEILLLGLVWWILSNPPGFEAQPQKMIPPSASNPNQQQTPSSAAAPQTPTT
jgi:hypothetical protein